MLNNHHRLQLKFNPIQIYDSICTSALYRSHFLHRMHCLLFQVLFDFFMSLGAMRFKPRN